MEKRILVVAAHPDDEVLGCGALVALRIAQGWEARLILLTGGIAGRSTIEKEPNAQAIEALRSESEKAAGVIGFSKVMRKNFPDNRLDTVSRMDVAHAISEELKTFKPHTVLTHHPGDYNWDHTIVFDAVLMAARCSPGEFSPQELLTFEVPSSTERSWQNGERAFHPNVFVNIESTIEKKKLALQCYQSELHEFPHPRSVKGIEFLARKRGMEVGVQFAEAFQLIRRVEG